MLIWALAALLASPPVGMANDDMSGALRRFKAQVAHHVAAFPQTFFVRAPTPERRIALTFDDGPDGVFTPRILDELQKAGVKATFFVVGSRVRRFPEVARRIRDEGHAIGGHGLEHIDLAKLPPEQAWQQQIEPSLDAIEEVVGQKTTLFRPPYGNITDAEIELLGSRGISIVEWSIDSFDWRPGHMDEGRIAREVLRFAHPGGIVLMHCGGANRGATVRALPRLLAGLRAQGYEFVTVPELLALDNVRHAAE